MKPKVIEEYERFWKRIFEYLKDGGYEAYSYFYYIVLTPSVRFNESRSFQKFFDRFSNLVDAPDSTPRYIVYLLYIMKLAQLYINHGFWPRKNAEGLRLLYDAIMRDFRTATPCSFEEALEAQEDIADKRIWKRSWYIIDSALKDANQDQVRKILEKSIVEENEFIEKTETEGAHVIILNYEADESFRSYVDAVLKKEFAGEPSEEELLKHLAAEKDGDHMKIPLKFAKLFYAALCAMRDYKTLELSIEEKVEQFNKRVQQLNSYYADQIRLLVEENEYLAQQVAGEKIIRKVHVGEERIAELERSYEAEIERLEEQIKMLKEQLDSVTQAPVTEETLKPFESPIEIAYFGLKNDRLEEQLARYNVFVRFYSPVKVTEDIPNLPIVFNVEVASHSVWNHIKHKKPLIVSGWNDKILAWRIVEWLAKGPIGLM